MAVHPTGPRSRITTSPRRRSAPRRRAGELDRGAGAPVRVRPRRRPHREAAALGGRREHGRSAPLRRLHGPDHGDRRSDAGDLQRGRGEPLRAGPARRRRRSRQPRDPHLPHDGGLPPPRRRRDRQRRAAAVPARPRRGRGAGRGLHGGAGACCATSTTRPTSRRSSAPTARRGARRSAPRTSRRSRVDESWVLKVCSDESSGGGFGVYVHQAGSAIAQPSFVQPGAELIVEEYLDLVENWCVHFCVEAIGAPRLHRRDGAADLRHRRLRRQPGRRHRPAAGRGRAVPGRRRARAGARVHRLLRHRHRADVLRRAAGVRSQLPDQREHPAAAGPQRDRGEPRPLVGRAAGAGRPTATAVRCPTWSSGSTAVYPDRALVPIASYDPAFTANGSGPSLLSALLLGDDEQDLRRLTELPLPADVGCSAANLDG